MNLINIKILFFLNDVDIDNILISEKASSSEKKKKKYFTGYKNDYKIKPFM